MYSRAQLRAITDELAGLRPDDPARNLLIQGWIEDAYARLGHALRNQDTITEVLVGHVLDRLGQRPEHDPQLCDEWDRHFAGALSHYAETGQLVDLPEWREHAREPEISPYRPVEKNRERDRGPELGR